MKPIIFLLLFPFAAFAQKAEQVASRNSYTMPAIVVGPLSVLDNTDNKLSFRFTKEEANAYIELSGSGWGAATINVGNEAIFLFSNDSTITVKSMEVQSFESGSETYKHRYAINTDDVKMLSRFELIGIRKYNFRDFSDIAIPRPKIAPIKNLSYAFLTELLKQNAAKTARL